MEIVEVHKFYVRKNGILDGQAYDAIEENTGIGLILLRINGKIRYVESDYNTIFPFDFDDYGSKKEPYLELKKDLWGVVNYKTGETVVDFDWIKTRLFDLSEDLLAVRDKSGWGFFNIVTGKLQIPTVHQDVKSFRHGYASAESFNKWGLMNKENKLIIPHLSIVPVYLDHDGHAVVYESGKILRHRKQSYDEIIDGKMTIYDVESGDIISSQSKGVFHVEQSKIYH